MKVSNTNDEITIYLNNYYIKDVNFLDVDSLENYMNKLFSILKKNYKIEISGFYNIDVYIDKNYGILINMKQDLNEYYECFSQVETQITIHNNSNFLYKVDDFFELKDYIINNNYSLYNYNDELFIKFNESISDKILTNVLEFCNEICFEDENSIKNFNLLYNNN